MSQSLLYHAFGVRKGYDYHRTSYEDGGVVFHLRPKAEEFVCPCGSQRLHQRGRRLRKLATVPIGLKPTWLSVEVPRMECTACQTQFEVSPPLPSPMSATPIS